MEPRYSESPWLLSRRRSPHTLDSLEEEILMFPQTRRQLELHHLVQQSRHLWKVMSEALEDEKKGTKAPQVKIKRRLACLRSAEKLQLALIPHHLLLMQAQEVQGCVLNIPHWIQNLPSHPWLSARCGPHLPHSTPHPPRLSQNLVGPNAPSTPVRDSAQDHGWQGPPAESLNFFHQLQLLVTI